MLIWYSTNQLLKLYTMKTKLLGIAALLLFNLNFIGAQEQITPYYVDTKTYTDYFAGNWNEVIRIGNMGLTNDIDFYYLRVRLGVAYLKKLNYMQSVVHLEKAYTDNKKDDFVIEMLYYAYLYAGDYPNAIKMAQKLPPHIKDKLGFEVVTGVQSFSTGGMFMYNQNTDERMNTELLTTPNQIDARYTVQDFKYLYYFGVSTANRKNKVWNFNVSHLKIYDIIMDQNRTDGLSLTNVDGTQTQFFVGRQQSFLNGWNWSIGTSVVYGKYLNLTTVTTNSGGRWTPATMWVYSNYMNFALGSTLKKNYGRIDLQLHTNISNLENSFQVQIGESVNFYPFGNFNLYLGSTLWQQFYDGTRVFADSKFGFGLFQKVWIETSYLSGNVEFYSKNNTAVIYNTPEKIKTQLGISVLVPFKKISFSVSGFSANKNNDIPYNTLNGTTTSVVNQYNTLTLLGGIKWNF